MIAQASPLQEEKPLSVKDKTLWVMVFAVLVVAATGAVIPAIFWGIWKALAGSIPKFWGFSRLLPDTISGAIYAIIIVVYFYEVIDTFDDLSEGGHYSFSFWDFVYDYPWLTFVGVFLAVSIIVGAYFCLAVGLAAFLALLIVQGLVALIRWSVSWICFAFYYIFSQLSGEDSSEADDQPLAK